MSKLKDESSDNQSTYYGILGLSNAHQKSRSISSKILRAAYRQTLLQHHPDKIINSSKRQNYQVYSVDQITQAYSTLLDPVTKAKYDHELKMRQILNTDSGKVADLSAGTEIIDLDEFQSDEYNRSWYRSCRCGSDQGFLILEKDLEAAANDQEICVECRGCSLMLKVLFSLSEEE
ncbi:Diphthamide biosynthesis protein 4 [Erysiphe neolycopersici]|uniref:Diphthamide biosynthesis protein 4 n=1 Tax=Erysiphe neolycopersici TaxID=212602 RepID=A0A420HX28_9PEZI|nr:Diphthamide biosynthesis protein 4 [Erysiphe neolycopersici]